MDGTAVGVPDGSCEGSNDGTKLGSSEGIALGCTDDNAVGVKLGLIDVDGCNVSGSKRTTNNPSALLLNIISFDSKNGYIPMTPS